MEQRNKTIITVFILFIMLILALAGLAVYYFKDKLYKEANKPMADSTLEVTDKKDAKYFDEYLSAFKSCSGEYISRNTDNFSDLDIYYFIENYYILQALKNDTMIETGVPGEYEYVISKAEVSNLIFKYFNTNKLLNLNVQDPNREFVKISNYDNSNYKLEWKSVGCIPVSYENPVVRYDGYNVTITYDVVTSEAMYEKLETIDNLVFNLKYNDGNYNIISINEK